MGKTQIFTDSSRFNRGIKTGKPGAFESNGQPKEGVFYFTPKETCEISVYAISGSGSNSPARDIVIADGPGASDVKGRLEVKESDTEHQVLTVTVAGGKPVYIYGTDNIQVFAIKAVYTGGTAPTEPPAQYRVSVAGGIQNGSVKVAKQGASTPADSVTAAAGETIVVTTAANAGYEVRQVSTTPETTVTKTADNTYTFTMPASAVSVSALFGKSGLTQHTVTAPYPEHGTVSLKLKEIAAAALTEYGEPIGPAVERANVLTSAADMTTVFTSTENFLMQDGKGGKWVTSSDSPASTIENPLSETTEAVQGNATAKIALGDKAVQYVLDEELSEGSFELSYDFLTTNEDATGRSWRTYLDNASHPFDVLTGIASAANTDGAFFHMFDLESKPYVSKTVADLSAKTAVGSQIGSEALKSNQWYRVVISSDDLGQTSGAVNVSFYLHGTDGQYNTTAISAAPALSGTASFTDGRAAALKQIKFMRTAAGTLYYDNISLKATGAKLEAATLKASSGDKVQVVVTPDSGYRVGRIAAEGDSGAVTVESDGTFVMPDSDVDVTVALLEGDDREYTVSAGTVTGGTLSFENTSAASVAAVNLLAADGTTEYTNTFETEEEIGKVNIGTDSHKNALVTGKTEEDFKAMFVGGVISENESNKVLKTAQTGIGNTVYDSAFDLVTLPFDTSVSGAYDMTFDLYIPSSLNPGDSNGQIEINLKNDQNKALNRLRVTASTGEVELFTTKNGTMNSDGSGDMLGDQIQLEKDKWYTVQFSGDTTKLRTVYVLGVPTEAASIHYEIFEKGSASALKTMDGYAYEAVGETSLSKMTFRPDRGKPAVGVYTDNFNLAKSSGATDPTEPPVVTEKPQPTEEPLPAGAIKARMGDVVKVTGTPETVGAVIETISSAENVTFKKVTYNVYTFRMPAKDVTVDAVFKADGGQILVDASLTASDPVNHKYKTVTEAIAAAKAMDPQSEADRVVVDIMPGVYREQVKVNTPYVTLRKKAGTEGEVKLTWYYGIGYYYKSVGPNGFYDATLAESGSAVTNVEPANWGAAVYLDKAAHDFRAENITLENSFNRYMTQEELDDLVTPIAAKPARSGLAADSTEVQKDAYNERSAAFYSKADRVVIQNCLIQSSQDTVGVSGAGQRLYFNQCQIEGRTDYICGEAIAVFNDCDLLFYAYKDIAKSGTLTAAKTPAEQKFGYLFYNCYIGETDDKITDTGTLGRPWDQNAQVTYYNTTFKQDSKLISEAGWGGMSGSTAENARFREYNSKYIDGTDVNVSKRTKGTVIPKDSYKIVEYNNPYYYLKGNDDWDPMGLKPNYTELEEISANLTWNETGDVMSLPTAPDGYEFYLESNRNNAVISKDQQSVTLIRPSYGESAVEATIKLYIRKTGTDRGICVDKEITITPHATTDNTFSASGKVTLRGESIEDVKLSLTASQNGVQLKKQELTVPKGQTTLDYSLDYLPYGEYDLKIVPDKGNYIVASPADGAQKISGDAATNPVVNITLERLVDYTINVTTDNLPQKTTSDNKINLSVNGDKFEFTASDKTTAGYYWDLAALLGNAVRNDFAASNQIRVDYEVVGPTAKKQSFIDLKVGGTPGALDGNVDNTRAAKLRIDESWNQFDIFDCTVGGISGAANNTHQYLNLTGKYDAATPLVSKFGITLNRGKKQVSFTATGGSNGDAVTSSTFEGYPSGEDKSKLYLAVYPQVAGAAFAVQNIKVTYQRYASAPQPAAYTVSGSVDAGISGIKLQPETGAVINGTIDTSKNTVTFADVPAGVYDIVVAYKPGYEKAAVQVGGVDAATLTVTDSDVTTLAVTSKSAGPARTELTENFLVKDGYADGFNIGYLLADGVNDAMASETDGILSLDKRNMALVLPEAVDLTQKDVVIDFDYCMDDPGYTGRSFRMYLENAVTPSENGFETEKYNTANAFFHMTDIGAALYTSPDQSSLAASAASGMTAAGGTLDGSTWYQVSLKLDTTNGSKLTVRSYTDHGAGTLGSAMVDNAEANLVSGREKTLKSIRFVQTLITGLKFDNIRYAVTDKEHPAVKYTASIANDITGGTVKFVTSENSAAYSISSSDNAADKELMSADKGIKAVTDIAGTVANNKIKIGNTTYNSYLQIRSTGSATPETGDSSKGGTVIKLTPVVSGTFTFAMRRQVINNVYEVNDGKDAKVLEIVTESSGNTSYSPVAGSFSDEAYTDSSKAYMYCTKTVQLEMGKTYVLSAAGTTIQLYGFHYSSETLSDTVGDLDAGDTLKVKAVADETDSVITVSTTPDVQVSPVENQSGYYTFLMPGSDVTVHAMFVSPVGPPAPTTYTVSGTVNEGIEAVSLTPASGSAISGIISEGTVSFADVPAGTYTITVTYQSGYEKDSIKVGEQETTSLEVVDTNINNLDIKSKKTVVIPAATRVDMSAPADKTGGQVDGSAGADGADGKSSVFGNAKDGTKVLYTHDASENGFDLSGHKGMIIKAVQWNKTNVSVKVYATTETACSAAANDANKILLADQMILDTAGYAAANYADNYVTFDTAKRSELTSSHNLYIEFATTDSGYIGRYDYIDLYQEWETYPVNVASIAGGTITVKNTYAAAGQAVEASVILEDGYAIKDGTLKASGASGDIAISATDKDTRQRFIMPAEEVTVTAELLQAKTVSVLNTQMGGYTTADVSVASSGDMVTLTSALYYGYQSASFSVNGTPLGPEAYDAVTPGKAAFTMPDENVTVDVTYHTGADRNDDANTKVLYFVDATVKNLALEDKIGISEVGNAKTAGGYAKLKDQIELTNLASIEVVKNKDTGKAGLINLATTSTGADIASVDTSVATPVSDSEFTSAGSVKRIYEAYQTTMAEGVENLSGAQDFYFITKKMGDGKNYFGNYLYLILHYNNVQ